MRTSSTLRTVAIAAALCCPRGMSTALASGASAARARGLSEDPGSLPLVERRPGARSPVARPPARRVRGGVLSLGGARMARAGCRAPPAVRMRRHPWCSRGLHAAGCLRCRCRQNSDRWGSFYKRASWALRSAFCSLDAQFQIYLSMAATQPPSSVTSPSLALVADVSSKAPA